MKNIEVIITHLTNMKVEKVKISEVKTNPKNPRLIKDDKFKKLVKSIQEFPQMLELRPIVVDENNIVLGGNMRLKACKEAGLKEVFIVKTDNLTEQQKDEFIVKDNVGFGEWDWDMLANEWDTELLNDWGLDLPIIMDEPSLDELIGEEKNKPASMKITFKTVEQLQEAENDIQELIDRKYNGAFYSVSAGEI
jgi:ParB-like chromosome segregation protein Spo0J